ncbi:hypothetical protein Tsubulata_022237, partial [Turnera subulata]
GKKGASLNRALEAQAIGGKPPYLESQIEFVGSLTAFRGEFVLACRDRALACLDTIGSHLLTISFAAAPSTATPHPHLLLCLSATASLPLSSACHLQPPPPLSSDASSSSSSSAAASFSSSSDAVFLFLWDCESLHSFPPPVATSLTVGRQLGDTVLKSKKMEPMDIAGKSTEDASLPKAHSRNRIGCKQPNTQFASKTRGPTAAATGTRNKNELHLDVMAYELHGRLAGNVSIITGENIKPSYGGDDEAFLRKEAKKSKNGQAPHSEWCNYDDLNETSECFSCGWPMRDDGTFSRSTNDGTQVAVTFDEEGLEGDLFGGKVMQSLSTKLRDSRYLL